MDHAVALVQCYLHVNGYFTVPEYPILEAMEGRGYRVTTDLDILAFRFPGAGRLVPGALPGTERFETDPVLECPTHHPEMLIGEVKEGRPEINQAIWDPHVMEVMLNRFGCCARPEIPATVQCLLRNGSAETACGHRIRLVVFGAAGHPAEHPRYRVIPLGHVVEFLRDHLRRHWAVLRHAQLKDPAFGFLAALEKATWRPATDGGRPFAKEASHVRSS